MLTNARPKVLQAFAQAVGDDVGDAGPADVKVDVGQIYRRAFTYSRHPRSEWDASGESTGRLIIGLAEVDGEASNRRNIVGVISSSAALTQALSDDLAEHLRSERASCDKAEFSLGFLIDLNERVRDRFGAHASSVRLAEESSKILVQANDESALRKVIENMNGHPVGVTVQTTQGKATITEDGSVIFGESISGKDVLELMTAVIEAEAVPDLYNSAAMPDAAAVEEAWDNGRLWDRFS
jgi:hypothetical protein